MTLTPSATYRTPGSVYGGKHEAGTKAARQYGCEGDPCKHCGAPLSRYNPLDTCSWHGIGGKKRKPRKRGEVASAGGSVVTDAAPPPRRVTQEDIEMAAQQRADSQFITDEVRRHALARDGDWFTASDIAARVPCGDSTAKRKLHRLCEEGLLESAPRKGFRLRQDPLAQHDAGRAQKRMPAATSPDCDNPAEPAPVSHSDAEECDTPLARMAAAAAAMTEEDRVHYFDDEDPAPAPTPEPPAPATPSPPPSGESSGAGTCEAITETGGALSGSASIWFTPKVGRARLSPVGILAAIEDLSAEERGQVLGCLALLYGEPKPFARIDFWTEPTIPDVADKVAAELGKRQRQRSRCGWERA